MILDYIAIFLTYSLLYMLEWKGEPMFQFIRDDFWFMTLLTILIYTFLSIL